MAGIVVMVVSAAAFGAASQAEIEKAVAGVGADVRECITVGLAGIDKAKGAQPARMSGINDATIAASTSNCKTHCHLNQLNRQFSARDI